MDFNGGRMMETNEDSPFSLNVVKEEKLDFDDVDFCEEKKGGETSRRGRTRSLSKKSADKVDIKAKLERSRQSARECRARKKLRYQYLEEIISETEKSISALRRELDCLKLWAKELDEGRAPPALLEYRRSFLEKKVPDNFKLCADVMMEEQGREILRHVQAAQAQQAQASTSPASSGIASASTSAGTATMAFSPTSSAFAAMMLSPSTLTHTISPS